MKPQYLTAKEVTAELGISFGTLYSYVSRGLIRSEETDGTTRHKRYWAEDVAALRNRRERKRDPTESAATALDFGDPVLESTITLIDKGKLYYRGHPAVTLAANHTAEEIAGLLWTSHLQPQLTPLPHDTPHLYDLRQTLLPALSDTLTPVERFHILLPAAEARDLAAHDKTLPGVCRTAGHIYALLLTALTGELPEPTQTLAQQLAAWRKFNSQIQPGMNQTGMNGAQIAEITAPPPGLTRLLDAALILCADHELNASSFTARCVASTGATPYGAVAAALAALQGPRHGGDTSRCEMLIREAQTHPRQALAAWLRRGERLPGFGHRLYPQGDPRARYLLEQLREVASQTTQSDVPHLHAIQATVDSLIQEVEHTFALRPNIDIALAAISLAFQMPAGAGITLFAAGRLMGWIAHIGEQYTTDALIRPRARYTGPTP